jgi:hypothetical protein
MKGTCSRKFEIGVVIVILDRVFFLGQIAQHPLCQHLNSRHPRRLIPSSLFNNYQSIMSETTKTKEAVVEAPPTFSDIMNKAGASALRGGTAGAVAMGANVACLMWMRTTVRNKWKLFRVVDLSLQ